MTPQTIFDNIKIVLDAMVVINFHGLLALDKLISWGGGYIVVEETIKKEIEINGSLAGDIDLTPHIESGSIIREEIAGVQQEELFYNYFGGTIQGTTIHKGEAACLALAISKDYGLASDERVIREEFQKKCPHRLCLNSWGIVKRAQDRGLIPSGEADDLKKGFFYV